MGTVLLQDRIPGRDGFPAFVDVAAEAGVTLPNVSGLSDKDYILETVGNGAAFFDYDGDGDLDLLIANGSTLENYRQGGDPVAALYRNEGGVFRDVTRDAGLIEEGWAMGVCVADYDNDGASDIYLTAYGPNLLYRNRGDGTFEEQGERAGVRHMGWGTNCAFGDYDRDGDVDLYVANYLEFDDALIPRRGESHEETCLYMGAPVFCGPRGLAAAPDVFYRNEGNGSFTDRTSEAGIDVDARYGFGVLFIDLDDDGWPDIYVANDSVPNFLFRNNRDGTFREVGLISGASLSLTGQPQAGMGVGAGDYDGNGLVDIFVTHFAQDSNTLYRNLGGLSFVDATLASGNGEVARPYLGWGTGFADLDNDGWPDIFVANGHIYPEVDGLDIGTRYRQRKLVSRNLGDGRFDEVGAHLGSDLRARESTRGSAFGDYDNDGDMDIVAVNMNAPPSLYRNESDNGNHWIGFRLEGVGSNRDAIGARVELVAGGRTRVAHVRSGGSYLSHDDLRIHFGLGSVATIDAVRVRWPNGETEELPAMDADRYVRIREGTGVVP
jgi:hypothetical protein